MNTRNFWEKTENIRKSGKKKRVGILTCHLANNRS